MRVFLTGGTGLIGSHLVDELHSRGHQVVALHRRNADTLFLEERDCALVAGDVRDGAESLAPLMEGCSHVVHAAAFVYSKSKWPKVRAVNVDGTRNVLTAAKQVGVEHAIHVSSVAAYGPVDAPVDESRALEGDLSPTNLYARSKREAEEVAQGVERVQGIPVTVVRPCAVYGERDRLFAPSIVRLLKRLPVFPVLGPGENTVPVVYAGNVAHALASILEAGRQSPIYDIGVDHPLTQIELIEGLARGVGKTPRLVRTPAPLIRGTVGIAAGLLRTLLGSDNLPMDRVVRLGLNDNPYGAARLKADLGWTAPHAHADALPRTGRWVANHI